MSYFKQPGLSSGKIGTFRNGGNPCGDLVLEQERLEAAGLFWTYAMEMGNIMEAIAQDDATGSKIFESMFFVTELKSLGFGDGSKAAAVVHGTKHSPRGGGWNGLDNELDAYIAHMESLIVRNESTGEEHKTHKDKANALARECMANPWKIPVTQTDFKNLKELANKIMDYPLPKWWWGMDWAVGDFLEHQKSEWQKEIYWESCEIDPSISDHPIIIKKKSKLDDLLVHGGVGGIIDLKWTGSFSTHMSRLRGGKWIQAMHYEESVRAKLADKVLPMLYVVGIAGSKGEPPLVTATSMKDGKCTGRPRCFCSGCREAEYKRTCLAYHQWEQSGRMATGRLKAREVEVWV